MIEFVVSLSDEVSAPAQAASESMLSAEKQAKVLESAVTSLQKAMVKSSALGDVDKLAKQSAQVQQYSGALEALKPQLEGAATSEAGLGEALGALAGPAGIALAAIGAVTVAFGAMVFQGAQLALEQTALKDKLLATFDALGEGPGAGKKTLAMLNDLSSQLPQTRAQLADWAKQYEALGVTDLGQLQTQLKATAAAQALMGDSGAAAFQNLQKKILEAAATGQQLKIPVKGLGSLAEAGLTVDDVARKMNLSAAQLGAQLKVGAVNAKAFGDAVTAAISEKGAGSLATMGADLATQWSKFKESIGELFEDVDVKPFLDAMHDLLGVFSQGAPSGQAMKKGITGAFDGIFKAASKIIPYIRRFFLDLVIWGLKGYIALKPIIKWAVELASSASFLNGVMMAAKGILITIGVVVGAVVVAVGGLVAGVVEFGLSLYTMVQVVSAAISMLMNLGKAGYDVAASFIDGLIGGITKGIGKAVDTVKDLGTSIVKGVKGVLGISSPSKVMMQLGVHTAGGFAAGVDAGAPQVASAAAGVGAVAARGAAGGAGSAAPGAAPSGGAPAAAGAKGGTAIHVEATFNFQGATKGAEDLTEQAVALIFERIALTQGLG